MKIAINDCNGYYRYITGIATTTLYASGLVCYVTLKKDT